MQIKQILRKGMRHNMAADLTKLERVRVVGGKLQARCPACAELGRDTDGDNLAFFDSTDGTGAFACSAYQGDAEHRRRIYALVGIRSKGTPCPAPAVRPLPVCKPARPLPALRRMGRDGLCQIARSRRWHETSAVIGMEILVERGQLHRADIAVGKEAFDSWVITDPSRLAAQARRMSGAPYPWIDSKPKTLTRGGRMVGATCIGERPEVWLMEGAPDLLAAPIVARLAGLDLEHIAFCAIIGANPHRPQLLSADLAHFADKRVIVAVHHDKNNVGQDAARLWTAQLREAGAEVQWFQFPEGCKDLADYLELIIGPQVAEAETSAPEAFPSPTPETPTPCPAHLCPTCWQNKIVAVIGGPTCLHSTSR